MACSSRRRHSALRTPKSALARPRRLFLEPLENRQLLAGITPPDGLVSWWAAEGTAVDWAGDNDGTAYLGAAYASGQVGQAFSFDGNNDRVEIADSESLELTPSVTIEGWVKVNAYPTLSEHAHILFRGDDRPGLDPYFLALTPMGALKFNVSGATGGKRLEGGSLPLGQFAHVAATLDDATGAMRLYVNGNLAAETFTTIRPLADLDPTFNAGVAIGNHAGYPSGGNNYPFNGLIDEVSLYNRALAPEELQSIYTAGLDGDGKLAISISDATATEGGDQARLIDVPISASSSPIDWPKSITKGPDGDFFVASANTNSVTRYDGATFQYLGDFVSPGSGGLLKPLDLVFTNGFLLVSSADSDAVLRYDGETGAFIDEFVPLGAFGIDRPTNLLVHSGQLFVGAWSGDVHRYDLATATFIDKFVDTGSGGLTHPGGIEFGPDGNFYVAEFISGGNNAVLRYDGLTGAFIDEFIPDGSGGMSRPAGMRFGPDGNLYIADLDNDRLMRFDAQSGAFQKVFVAQGLGGLDEPTRFIFDGNQLLLVSQESDRVVRYDVPAWVSFTISLSSPSNLPVSINYSTTNGSATAGSDYTAATGTITFAPGQTSQTILVETLDDAVYEGTETFVVNLSNPVSGVIADGQGVATITDNESPPTKFYVVNDASTNRTYEYGSTGSAVENYALNSANSTPRGAASTAAGDKVWVVDSNRKVYVYDPSGTLLGSWTAGTLATSANVQGITTNGTDVWIVDAKSDKVFKYAGAATRLSGSQNAASSFSLNSGNKDATDLVTDGTQIWVLNNSSTDKVFRYSVSGTLQGSWTISGAGGSPTGLTIDPSNVSNIWIVDSSSDRVYQFNAAASRTSGSQTPSTSFALAAGNTNPQGISDPPVPSVGGQTAPTSGSSTDSAFDSALLSIVGELDGLLAGGKKRK